MGIKPRNKKGEKKTGKDITVNKLYWSKYKTELEGDEESWRKWGEYIL